MVSKMIPIVSGKKLERNNVVIKLLLKKGSLRFNQIWGEVKGNSLFTSKRDLWDTLHFLTNHEINPKSMVERIEKTRKNVVYNLRVNKETESELLSIFEQIKNQHPKVLGEIREPDPNIKINQLSSYFEASIYLLIGGYLNILETYAKSGEGLQDFVLESILKPYVVQDAQSILEMKKAFQKSEEQAITNVREKLKGLCKMVLKDSKIYDGEIPTTS